MRRSLTAALVVLSMAGSVLLVPGSLASAHPTVVDPLSDVTDPALARATDALDGATATAEPPPAGAQPSDAPAADEAPTLALRDLFLALPRLDATERRAAHGLLARPTDGSRDEYDDGYTVPAKRDCAGRICIHWVGRTKDAPPNRRWVSRSLRVMKNVWAEEVGRLGYRRPVTDGRRGGNAKFDVYLKDVGSEGFYGYCVPERRKPGHRWVASGYCVLDDDFARRQFDARPRKSLRVTAAHEFFHAIQFGYDYAEDGWLMEATATWVEERVADGADDNRRYLEYGQVHRPQRPLDRYQQTGFGHYGNWAFFEYLSQRYGVDIVRRIWENAAGPPRNYSTRAVKRSLPDGATFPEVFRAYAAANTTPALSYFEGAAWPAAPMARTYTLKRSSRGADGTLRVDHMAARHVLVRPAKAMRGMGWTLRLRVDGPAVARGAAAYAIVHRPSGTVKRWPIALDRDGRGGLEVRFGSRRVKRVTLTLANASTGFDCWRQQLVFSCQGRPRGDNRSFTYAATAVRS